MSDDTNALEQVSEAVEESALTDEDVEELRALLGKLEDELDVYRNLGDLFSLGGRGYKRVIRAPDGVTVALSSPAACTRTPRFLRRKTRPIDLPGLPQRFGPSDTGGSP